MSEQIGATPDLVLMMVMRWRETWRNSMASAVAAGLAWVLAQHLFGHSKPLFAAISAIICLSPGLPSHAGQALGLLVGVAIGSVVGELSLFLPEGWPLLRLGVAAFVAIFAAATWGFRQWFLSSPASPPSWCSRSALKLLGRGACSTSQAAPRSACCSARFLLHLTRSMKSMMQPTIFLKSSPRGFASAPKPSKKMIRRRLRWG